MIRKTDKYFKRTAFVWGLTSSKQEKVVEYVRREIWWLFFILPIYIKETVVDKPK